MIPDGPPETAYVRVAIAMKYARSVAGYGAVVIRPPTNDIIGWASGCTDSTVSTDVAILAAITTGLRAAWDLGISSVTVQTDSLSAIESMHGAQSRSRPKRQWQIVARGWANRFSSIQYEHIKFDPGGCEALWLAEEARCGRRVLALPARGDRQAPGNLDGQTTGMKTTADDKPNTLGSSLV